MKKSLFYYFKILILALIVCFPIILPYLRAGYFPTHDGEWAVVRLGDMYREIKDSQIPARLSGYLNFEYGYPLFNFAYPAPYYFGLIFVFLKLGFVNSIKILFALSAVLSFFSMFLLSESLWKSKWAGFISAVLYIYVPYRIVDLYVRGSIGESLSFILFPFILLGIKKIYEDGYSFKNIAITGLLLAILITTHNVMTVLFGIVILLIVLLALFKKQIRFALNILLSLIYSLCISAFFWIPAIFEKHLVLLSKIPIADRSANFVHFEQLLIPKWGYGVPIDSNGFGYQVGIPQLIVLAVALIFVIKNKDFKAAAFLISATFLISLLLFSQSSFVWSQTPLLSEINYPWTILAIIALLISLLAGYLTKLGKPFLFLALILGVLSVILIFPHAKPQQTVNRGDDFYITNQATTTSSNELMPLWVKKLPNQKPEKKIEVRLGQVNNISSTSRKISFSVDLPKPETVRINTIYYPGWKFFVDGKITKINYNNDSGVMNINVNSGSHLINGLLEETSLRLLSDAISLISIFSLIVFAIPSYKPLRKTK